MERQTLESRVDELESRLSFQDNTIAELDSVIRSQQQEIDSLKIKLDDLLKLQSAKDEGVDPGHEKPPHY